jgi:hypothetical protein
MTGANSSLESLVPHPLGAFGILAEQGEEIQPADYETV